MLVNVCKKPRSTVCCENGHYFLFYLDAFEKKENSRRLLPQVKKHAAINNHQGERKTPFCPMRGIACMNKSSSCNKKPARKQKKPA